CAVAGRSEDRRIGRGAHELRRVARVRREERAEARTGRMQTRGLRGKQQATCEQVYVREPPLTLDPRPDLERPFAADARHARIAPGGRVATNNEARSVDLRWGDGECLVDDADAVEGRSEKERQPVVSLRREQRRVVAVLG